MLHVLQISSEKNGSLSDAEKKTLMV
jgi:hypothetical protein